MLSSPSKPVTYTTVFAVAVLLALNFASARLSHRTSIQNLSHRHPPHVESSLPNADVLRATFLNFETLAADLAWVWSVVYWGRHRSRRAPPKHLEHNAETIADLDPRFYDVYKWFDTTYLRSRHPPSHGDVEKVNAFLERGMTHFPTRYELPYSAGLNYIGNAEYRTDEQYVENLSKAIDYLERASRLSGAPSDLPLTVSWLYQRRRQLRATLDEGDQTSTDEAANRRMVEFLAEMYYTVDDQRTRRKIERIVTGTDRGRQLLTKFRRQYRRKLRRKRRASYAYLPLVIWTSVAPATP